MTLWENGLANIFVYTYAIAPKSAADVGGFAKMNIRMLRRTVSTVPVLLLFAVYAFGVNPNPRVSISAMNQFSRDLLQADEINNSLFGQFLFVQSRVEERLVVLQFLDLRGVDGTRRAVGLEAGGQDVAEFHVHLDQRGAEHLDVPAGVGELRVLLFAPDRDQFLGRHGVQYNK